MPVTRYSHVDWFRIGITAPSAGHWKAGKPLQDRMMGWPTGVDSAPISTVAVCDGHGHGRHFRSAIGAEVAAEIAVRELARFTSELWKAEGEDDPNLVQQLCSIIGTRICEQWKTRVRQHSECEPFPPRHLAQLPEDDAARYRLFPEIAYGSTLLAASLTNRFGLVFGVGDGIIACCEDDGEVSVPLGECEKKGPATASLCSPDAAARMNFRFLDFKSTAPPRFVVMASDGYPDVSSGIENFQYHMETFNCLLDEQGISGFQQSLKQHLQDEADNLFDDATLVFLIRSDWRESLQ